MSTNVLQRLLSENAALRARLRGKVQGYRLDQEDITCLAKVYREIEGGMVETGLQRLEGWLENTEPRWKEWA